MGHIRRSSCVGILRQRYIGEQRCRIRLTHPGTSDRSSKIEPLKPLSVDLLDTHLEVRSYAAQLEDSYHIRSILRFATHHKRARLRLRQVMG